MTIFFAKNIRISFVIVKTSLRSDIFAIKKCDESAAFIY